VGEETSVSGRDDDLFHPERAKKKLLPDQKELLHFLRKKKGPGGWGRGERSEGTLICL